MIPWSPGGLLVLLTDFGTDDAYPAELHGVVLSSRPSLRIIDATHGIPPGDVRTGAFLLRRIRPSFPPGTVFLAVVDPGVGTSRRAVAVRSGPHVLVGPDNGLLGWAADVDAAWHELVRPGIVRQPVAPTFHGRDLFAPFAAALAAGALTVQECGPRVPDPVLLPLPGFRVANASATGVVLHVDRFGNLVVSVPAASVRPPVPDGAPVRVRAGDRLHDAVWGPYGRSDALCVHADSSGYLEIALRDGRASDLLGIGTGGEVVTSW